MKHFYTLLVLLLTLSSGLNGVNAQDKIPDNVPNEAQWMPDANLRTAVRTALQLADGEILTQAAMADLTKLIAKRASIANLSGLEHATNLTKLDLRHNTVSNISAVTGLTELTHLWLTFNSITDISSLSGLTNLRVLSLKDNAIGSITTLANLTNLRKLWIKNCGITDVSPLTGLVNLRMLRIAENALTNAHLLRALTSLTDVDITIPDPPTDVDPPGVSISVPSGVQSGPFSVTATFTETVSGFAQSDVSLSGSAASITSWSTNSDNTVYTATITPTASGTVTIGVAANVATDAANNQNTAATSKTVTVDVDKPTVTINVPSGTQNGAFSVTITFTETVSGFVQSDVSLSGSAASITSWSTNSDNTVYTATITPTASGTVTIGVAANVATDAANNQNTAATSKSVTVTILDTTQPGVTISVKTEHVTTASDSVSVNGPFKVIITFTEPVFNFEQSDIWLEKGRAEISNFSASGATTYTADVTPELDKDKENRYIRFVIPSGAATDAAGNPNREAEYGNVWVDMERPNVYITAPTSNVTTETFTVSIKFTHGSFSSRAQKPFGFDQSDLSLINNTAGATVTGWSVGTDHITTATITVTQSGSVTFRVAEGVATDHANNNNTASLLKTVTVRRPGSDPPESADTDTTEPGVTISLKTEHVTTASDSVSVNGPFKIIITFTEAVSNFEQSDILLERGRAEISNFSASGATTYTADVTPELDDDNRYINFVIPSGAATDAAGNPNRESEYGYAYIDMERPNVYITAPTSNVTTETFTVTIKFADEPNWRAQKPFGFDQSDLSLINNTAGATVTGWSVGTDHITTATITVTQSGSVTFRVAEGIATDSANNNNTASLLKTVTVRRPGSDPPESTDTDTTQPGVTISVETEHVTTASDSVSVNGPFKITVTFTESVSNFEQSDILLEKGRAEISNFSASGATTYTADVTPELNEGNRYIRFVIPSGAATDAAGNPNHEAAYGNAWIDMERPNVYITVPTSNVTTETFTVTIKFADEPNWRVQKPFGFDQSDLFLINNTAGATVTGWSVGTDHITTATITVTQSGSVTFRVDEGVATDSANNNNTASLLKTVTVTHPNAAPSANGSVPDQTLLQANYPNPFNPETWIPYQLASDTDVEISIYDVTGMLVRQLDLGHQRAGYYTDRSRAAHWNGRNEFGERVATGIYFYQLRTDKGSFLRKMVILK